MGYQFDLGDTQIRCLYVELHITPSTEFNLGIIKKLMATLKELTGGVVKKKKRDGGEWMGVELLS